MDSTTSAAVVAEAKPAVESTSTAAASTDSAAPRAAFHYPPYVAIMLIPLAFIKTFKTAVIAWYWINVGLILIAGGLATYTLSGSFSSGRRGMLAVPLLAAIPFIYYFLPVAWLTLLALVLVLAALAIYRQKMDAIAGLVASIAAFSPFGMALALYFLLKRSWLGLVGYAVGLAIVAFGVPMLIYKPDGALNQYQTYQEAVVSPYLAHVADPQLLGSPDNQSVWGMLIRRQGEINDLGTRAAAFAEAHKLDVPQVTSHWTEATFIAVGVILFFATLVGVTRKLRERGGPIVGLEGALLVLAVLILAPVTYLPDMVVVMFPLFAVVHAIMLTDLKRLVHHINYVGIVLATAFFYLTFDEGFKEVGSAFAGAFILWVAVLAAINRFRPQIVHGRAAASFASGPSARADKPIEMAKISPKKESIARHIEEHRQSLAVNPSRRQTPDSRIAPIDVHGDDESRTKVQHPSGLAKLFMHFKSKDLPSLDLGTADTKEKSGGKNGDKPAVEIEPAKDRKIPLE